MHRTIDKELLKQIGMYITDGLTEEESCIMAGCSYDDLNTLKENNEDIRIFIEKMKVKFKHAHLKEMQSKKSEKTSQWLLERLRPEDFYIGARSKVSNQTVNIIGTIINEIQEDRNTGLIASTQTRQGRIEQAQESDKDSKGRKGVIQALN
jgi:hypothetical protein